MDFSIPGSDSWESTPTQDNLIKHYFQPKEEQITARKDGKIGKSNVLKKQNTISSPTKLLHSKDTGQLLKKKNRKPKKKSQSISNERETSTEPISPLYAESEKSELKIKKTKKNISRSTKCESNLEVGGKTLENNKFVFPKEIEVNEILSVKIKPRKKLLNTSTHYFNTDNASNPKIISPKSRKRKMKLDKLHHCETQESDDEESPFTKAKKLKLMKNLKKKLEEAKNSEDSEAESENPIYHPQTKFQKINDTKEIKKQKKMRRNEQFYKLYHCETQESDHEESTFTTKAKKLKLMKNLKKNLKEAKNSEDPEAESENPISHPQTKFQKTNDIKEIKKQKKIGRNEQFENRSEGNEEESDDEESTFTNKAKKLKLMKNLKKKIKEAKNSEDSEAESENPISHLQTKCQTINDTKEIKKQKKIERKEQFENRSEGNEESDDEKIMMEIKNSSVYKKIQGLMKEFPSLQNLQDSDISEEEDLSSGLDISESDTLKTKSIDLKENAKMKTKSQNGPSAKSITESNTLSSKLIFNKKPGTDLSKTVNNTVNFPRSTGDFPRSVAKTDDLPDSSNMTKDHKLDKNDPHAKLRAAKFRCLNEKLYTETGSSAFQYFQENKAEFDDYHTGYNLQVSKWPINPVDKIISDLQNNNRELVIVDMGCGDAKIARTLTKSTVHSFDIVALNDHVTACNISKVPIAKESVDIVVFCLSLMGTNFKEYLLEAHRILKMGGILKIAEVESRMEDVSDFISKLKNLGFLLEKKDLKHKMFVFLDFKKGKKKLKKDKIPSLTLKPCMYKKR